MKKDSAMKAAKIITLSGGSVGLLCSLIIVALATVIRDWIINQWQALNPTVEYNNDFCVAIIITVIAFAMFQLTLSIIHLVLGLKLHKKSRTSVIMTLPQDNLTQL
jgi:hypothetical protein